MSVCQTVVFVNQETLNPNKREQFPLMVIVCITVKNLGVCLGIILFKALFFSFKGATKATGKTEAEVLK